MDVRIQRPLLRSTVSLVFLAGGMLICGRLAAQDSTKTKGAAGEGTAVRSVDERVKIQPYTGAPIYLDEPEQVAAPTIVRRDMKKETYEDGKTRTERQLALFSDNHFEADGVYREYYNSGKPFVEGEFRRGRQNGEWTYWYENGQVNRKATYKNGQPDGTWDVFRADGTLLAKRSFQDGQRHGDWIKYDETGKQSLEEEHYDKSKADGIWKTWLPNGQLKRQNSFKQGARDGVSTEWTDKGEKRGEVTYVNNKLDGPSTFWLPDGRKIVQQYKDGRLISESKQ
ncbi:MAG: toxin-antitoxin system YwqK family antitoxin [Pirellulales bacterium]